MAETATDTTYGQTKTTDAVVEAIEHYSRRNDRPYATRPEVIGELSRDHRSLENIHRAMRDASRTGEIMRHPTHSDRLIAINSLEDEIAVAMLADALEAATGTNQQVLQALEARLRELRQGGGQS